MSVVIGTAGHIDHGKTTLLRALTGIDADRLPEERRRGMTIDVGYAHLALPDGSVLDFVDVPGHDRLVGNMLVGAGEIDAALLVIAADDGPNAQTIEHLELLDAIGIRRAVVAVTKADLAGPERAAEVAAQAAGLVARTSLAGSPVVPVSAVTGAGLEALLVELEQLREAVEGTGGPEGGGTAGPDGPPTRLAVDRVFPVRGRGTVVTGTLRGRGVAPGHVLRLLPEGHEVRVREVQVRGQPVPEAGPGRTALLLGSVEAGAIRRGQVLVAPGGAGPEGRPADPAEPGGAVVATSRLLVAIRPAAGLRHPAPALEDRERLRLHLGTAQAEALVIRGPREAIELPDGSLLALLRLDGEIAAAPGDRFALRRPSPGAAAGGGVVLDAQPPRGVSRRRLTAARAGALLAALGPAAALGQAPAHPRLELHGAVADGSGWRLAADVESELRAAARGMVSAHHEAEPDSPGLPLPALRASLVPVARRKVTLGRPAAEAVARRIVEGLVADGSLARDGDRLRDPSRGPGLPATTRSAMDRLVAALSVPAPPPLGEAARAAGCPPEGVRALQDTGRIVRAEDDLAWAADTYRGLVKRAIAMAAAAPLSPAAFRDATGTSRRYVLVILEDLDRRGLLRRTDAGHVLGPKTLARLREQAAAAGRQPDGGPG